MLEHALEDLIQFDGLAALGERTQLPGPDGFFRSLFLDDFDSFGG